MKKINLAEKFKLIDQHWSPRILAELNGQHVKIAKIMGSFDWHHHEHEDELFLIIDGHLRMELKAADGTESSVELKPGEIFVVPRGVEHRPVAEEETQILMFEPMGTLNTGNIQSERTVDSPGLI